MKETDTIKLGTREFVKPKGITVAILDRLKKRFGLKHKDLLKNEFFQSLDEPELMCEFFATILEEAGKEETNIDELKNYLYKEVDVREMSEVLKNFFDVYHVM